MIFGTKARKQNISADNTLKGVCPNCSNGNLVHKKYKRWFMLFFVPIIPLEEIDRFYECDNCSSAYNENIKQLLESDNSELQKSQKESKKTYARALVAVMTHMAVVDGDYAEQEEEEIRLTISEFAEMQEELLELHAQVKKYKNQGNFVFQLLQKARKELSSEVLMKILAQAGRVLLADGNIEKEEEDLLKEYLASCGLPKDLCQVILSKLGK